MTALELLAPAKTADIGIAAIRCGADAVYIGGPAFGARSAAGNSIEDIRRLCAFAAAYGVRIYVTVNTLAQNEAERKDILALMLALKDSGVSAFILQDLSLLPKLWECGPWKEEFHASTQCTINSPEKAVELAGLGFSRLILERQLSLKQIRRIRAAVPDSLELECFVHGALCVCYSGACYLSEALTGRSANRGECAQPCRSRYDLIMAAGDSVVPSASNAPEKWVNVCDADGKPILNRPLLSLKDLNLINRLDDLASSGIVSFKIEGRLKNESYVKNVVRAYSEALDRLIAAHPEKYCRASLGTVRGGFTPSLSKTFNRGYTELFLDGQKGKWNSSSATKGVGEKLGKWQWLTPGKCGFVIPPCPPDSRSRCASDGKGSDIPVNRSRGRNLVHNGDGLCFESPKGEIVGLRADRVESDLRHGSVVFCKDIPELKNGVEIWRNRDSVFEKELENNTPDRMINVTLRLTWADRLNVVAIREDGTGVSCDFEIDAPVAENQERMQNLIVNQLSKRSGFFDFQLDSFGVPPLGLPLLSAAFLNEIRRTMAEKLAALPICRQARNAACPTENAERKSSAGCIHSSFLVHKRSITSEDERPLMVSKYCILHELGLCRKAVAGKRLALRNNGRIIPLRFDCTQCEMSVLNFTHSSYSFAVKEFSART